MNHAARCLAVLIAALSIGSSEAAHADAAAEARTAGNAAWSALSGTLPASREILESMTPGYTDAPPEISLDEGNFTSAASARLAECDAADGDVGCEATLSAHADATARADSTSAMRDDAEVVNALARTRDVSLDGLSAVYGDCVTESIDAGVTTRDIQYCHNYYRRDLGLQCSKERDVKVILDCPEDSTLVRLGGIAYCEKRVLVAKCNFWQFWVPERGLCASYEDMGIFYSPPSIWVEEIKHSAPTAQVIEAWNNLCEDYEERVPPGTLRPDGEATPDNLPFPSTGRVDKCVRSESICIDAEPRTRIIDGQPVTRECWAYANTFDCVSSTDVSDCNQPRFGSCSPASAPTCIDRDEQDGYCTAERLEFDCSLRDTRRSETRLNCGAQTFSDRDGNVWDASYPPDPDLLSVVTFMEAGRQAGRYIDQDSLTVFNGVGNSCKKKLFGLINCCNRGGIDPQMFNNLSAIMGVAGTVGNALASTYMFDALFVSDAPNWVISGFSSLFGSGTSSTLAGLLTGNLTVSQFATSLIPGPWTIAMMAVQMSGILSCSENEQVLAMKRDSDLCVDNGSRCSKRLPVVRTCIERTYSYCCFNSRLAKLINRQGRVQLGISDGGCGGFTIAQLQALDLSAMDLSEFMDEIRAAALEMPALAPGRIGACAVAGGVCE